MKIDRQRDKTIEPQTVSSSPHQSDEMAEAWKVIAQLTATVTPLAEAVTRLAEKLGVVIAICLVNKDSFAHF